MAHNIIGNGKQSVSSGGGWDPIRSSPVEKVAVNHIQRIMQENQVLKVALQTWEEKLNLLRQYLESSKFQQDTSVQVKDVFL